MNIKNICIKFTMTLIKLLIISEIASSGIEGFQTGLKSRSTKKFGLGGVGVPGYDWVIL
jgi:hypothetical protein